MEASGPTHRRSVQHITIRWCGESPKYAGHFLDFSRPLLLPLSHRPWLSHATTAPLASYFELPYHALPQERHHESNGIDKKLSAECILTASHSFPELYAPIGVGPLEPVKKLRSGIAGQLFTGETRASCRGFWVPGSFADRSPQR